MLLMVATLLSGCVGSSNRDVASSLAKNGYMNPTTIKTDYFDLLSYNRLARPGSSLTIYIEGDGMAWLNRHKLSKDPTPRNPTSLRLAVEDASGNVAYLGRPCQYVKNQQRRNCHSGYWSRQRFAKEVITSTNQAIDILKKRAQATVIHLIGYSGGGAVAVLAAAARDDVATIRTIAGNLDHVAFTNHHGVSPLSDSLNPKDVAENIKNIPQIHFVGGRDNIIPAFIANNFIAAQKKKGRACAKVRELGEMQHDSAWENLWPRLLTEQFTSCN